MAAPPEPETLWRRISRLQPFPFFSQADTVTEECENDKSRCGLANESALVAPAIQPPPSLLSSNLHSLGNIFFRDSTRSMVSSSTYYSAVSRLSTNSSRTPLLDFPYEGDEYAQLLRSHKLWPVHPDTEQNWSGRGQHVRFQVSEQPLINSGLEVVETLGSTRTAIVQSVRCRRILLARKTIFCGKRSMTPIEAIDEVVHLTRLNHAHVVRVIGTYVKGRELSILLYPVADCNLEDYLHDIYANPKPILLDEWWDDYYTMQSFYHCLSSALKHIHKNFTKHMDIKPQNILTIKSSKRSKPMIADFGIARSYQSLEDTETDGATSFTKRYAAPEVVKQDSRGLFADIFSMGCVFLEIFAATQANYRGDLHGTLQNIRKNNVLGDTSYQANLTDIQNALSDFWVQHHSDDLAADNYVLVIRSMLEEKSLHRPTAEELVSHFPERPCCGRGTPKFKAKPTGK